METAPKNTTIRTIEIHILLYTIQLQAVRRGSYRVQTIDRKQTFEDIVLRPTKTIEPS